MSVQYLYDTSGSVELACLYDTTTDTAFGPVFYGELADGLDDFLAWLPGDPRKMEHDRLVELRNDFHSIEILRAEARQGYRCCSCGEEVTAGQYDDLQTNVKVYKTPGGTDIENPCPSCKKDDWDEIELCARCGKAIDDENQHLTCYS